MRRCSAEIGYWLRTNALGHGYMSEAVEALTDEIFNVLPVSTVTIICDPLNVRSAAVPERLGFENTASFLRGSSRLSGRRT